MPEERPHLSKQEPLAGKYQILEDINTGSFGHVVLCKDTSREGHPTVAVKVQDRPEERYHQDFKIEIDILVTICSRPERPRSIVEMLEYFLHRGRWCITFEFLGPSLWVSIT
mmetsp:Transcript_1978/g.4209  ORF Transcript_1978/g.4209 Transcript_1978/m.4209 type:complete len:112 (-) Transcript_1978:50-385(-)